MSSFAHRRRTLMPVIAKALDVSRRTGEFDVGFVGDIYPPNDMLCESGPSRMSELRETIWKPLAGSSVIVGNLESPITIREAPAEQKPYLHRTATAAVHVLDHRVVLSLANNHIMDFGPGGLSDTMDALDMAGIPHAGAGCNIRQANAPRCMTVDGVRVAVVCAADPRFSPASPTAPGTCPARAALLVETIEAAVASADLIVVSLHMGLEYVSVPSAVQIALAEACLNAGAHVVHYHHAHCLSGAATNGRGLVLFGTGNYVFPGAGNPVSSARRTAAWRVRFDRRTRKVVALGAHPAIIDSAGLPRALEGQARDGEIERLNALSRIMLGGAGQQFSRLKDFLNPGFLRFNARNYWFLLRRRGPLHVLRSLGAGIGAQLFGRQG